jgi:amino acid transporter
LFVLYLAEFWPDATHVVPRLLVLTLLIGIVAVVNYCGVRGGTQLSNVFTGAKLLPLLLLIVAGGAYILATGRPVPFGISPATPRSWIDTLLLLIFAYGGFEGALFPMSEVKDPRRDAPFALGAGLLTCSVVYVLIQVVVIGLVPNAAQSDRPLAAAAHVFLGPAGAGFMAIAALVSVYGYEASMMLNTPRLTFALAEKGDFPRIFAAVHPRFRTPHVSIAVFAVLLWVLAITGSFQWNATLSAIARIFFYATVCAAMFSFRRRDPAGARFRVPGGPVTAVLGILLSLLMLTGIRIRSVVFLALVFLLALLNWLWVRRRYHALPR